MNYRDALPDDKAWQDWRHTVRPWGDIVEDGGILRLQGYGLELGITPDVVKGDHSWVAAVWEAENDEEQALGFPGPGFNYRTGGPALMELLLLRDALENALRRRWCDRFRVEFIENGHTVAVQDRPFWGLAIDIAKQLADEALVIFAAWRIDELRKTSSRLLGD